MASRQVCGPGRIDLGYTTAAAIAAAGRQEEARRLRALVGEVPKRDAGKPQAGPGAARSRRLGSGEATAGKAARKPVRKPARKQLSRAAGKESAKRSGPLRIQRLRRLTAVEQAGAIKTLAVMRPGKSFSELRDQLSDLTRQAGHSADAKAVLDELVAIGVSGGADQAMVSFARQRRLGSALGSALARPRLEVSPADFTQQGPVLRPPRDGWPGRRLWWQVAAADRGIR